MNRDPAMGRVMAIGLVRLGGAVLIMGAILVAQGIIPWPVEAGYALAAAGMLGVFALPQIMARRWRSPRE